MFEKGNNLEAYSCHQTFHNVIARKIQFLQNKKYTIFKITKNNYISLMHTRYTCNKVGNLRD